MSTITNTTKLFDLVKKSRLGPQIVPFGQMFWEPEMNGRDDYGTEDESNEITRALMRGWGRDQTAQAMLLDDLPTDMPNREKYTLEYCMTKRNEQWHVLKEGAVKDKSIQDLLTIWERFYVQDGKLIEPIYFGNSCFRRSARYVMSQVLAFTDANNTDAAGHPLPLVYDLPVNVIHFGNDTERVTMQIQENDKKREGARDLSDIERLKYGRKLFRNAVREVEFRKTFEQNEAVRVFQICALDNKYRELHIFDRIVDAAHPDKLTYKRFNKDTTRKWVKETKTADEIAVLLHEQEHGERKRQPKSMARDKVEAVKNSPNDVAVDMAKAFLDDSDAVFSLMAAIADACNMARAAYKKSPATYNGLLEHMKKFEI